MRKALKHLALVALLLAGILLSGMGADARVFARQMEAIPQIMVPEWTPPMQKDSLESYAERLAKEAIPLGSPATLEEHPLGVLPPWRCCPTWMPWAAFSSA